MTPATGAAGVATAVAWSAFAAFLLLAALRAALGERARARPPWSRPVRGRRVVALALVVAVLVLGVSLGVVVISSSAAVTTIAPTA